MSFVPRIWNSGNTKHEWIQVLQIVLFNLGGIYFLSK
jgi:hypothetical protein